jgi:hypothetical protein
MTTAQRYAVIGSGGRVENVILADGSFSLEGKRLVPDPKGQAHIGGTYRGTTFKAPAEPSDAFAFVRKADIWERATEEEAEKIAQAFDEAPARLRGIWAGTPILDPTDANFAEFREIIAKAVGTKKRADELLAPSGG